MIKGKILSKCRQYFEEYLFGFDQNQLQMSLLSGNINLNNVNIRPDKVNEIFAKQNIPLALKAGLISNISIKVNLISLFSDSLKITLEDILFIVGPNISHISQDSDFEQDINKYDENNPLKNLIRMHQRVKQKLDEEREVEKQKNMEEKIQKAEKMKKKYEEHKKKEKEFKEPPMSIIINLLGGLKLEIKRIHFRYEDDYFQHHKPFSFGLMIDFISMDNSETDWTFDTPTSMGFVRNPPSNPKTVNKELNVKNIKVYWNSMSEMFVPTSLWEQTRHLKYQIFDAMDASFLKDIMVDAFNEKSTLHNNFLVSPFTLCTSINLNKSFRPNEDPYKYQVVTLISTINLNLTPGTVRDILKFQTFLEMFSYSKELKRFRPLLKIQTFIDTPAYTPAHKLKRAQLIREWFQLVLWYIRLRKRAKGAAPYNLLEIEEAVQGENLKNALLKVKRAKLEDYQPYYGSDDERDPENQEEKKIDQVINEIEEYEKEQSKQKKNQVLKDMLGGTKFTLKLEGVKAKVFSGKKIKRQHQEIPQLEFDLGVVAVLLGIQNHDVVVKVLLKEIKLLDYYKREQMRAFSRQLHNAGGENGIRNTYYDSGDDRARSSAQSRQQEPRGTLGGVTDMISNMFKRQQTNNEQDGKKIGDIIRGSKPERVQSRQTPVNPMEFFAFDIPDPTKVKNQTRETMAISDLLTKPPRVSTASFQQSQFMSGGLNKKPSQDNAYLDTTPTKGSRVQKAQKFHSPTKSQALNAGQQSMNNNYLNARSEVFVDDQLESVEKRCFFLMCGRSQSDSTISIDIVINAFDDPGVKKKITLALCLDQIIIEYCNEILKSLTNLGLQYKIAFNFSDLTPAPAKNKTNKKKNLQRMLEMQAPLYVLRKLLLKRSLNISQEAVETYQTRFYMEKEKSKSVQDKAKEQREKQFKTVQKIKELDKKLTEINFDVGVLLKSVYVGLTGDKDDPFTANQTLVELGIDNQSIQLQKEDFKCKVNVFGASVTTLNTFEMLFNFGNKLNKVTTMYKDNLAVQTSMDTYKEFIKNINKHLEKQKDQKKKEEEKQGMKKNAQPKIVIVDERENKPTKVSAGGPMGGGVRINADFGPPKQSTQMNPDRMMMMGGGPQVGFKQSGPSFGPGKMQDNERVVVNQQLMGGGGPTGGRPGMMNADLQSKLAPGGSRGNEGKMKQGYDYMGGPSGFGGQQKQNRIQVLEEQQQDFDEEDDAYDQQQFNGNQFFDGQQMRQRQGFVDRDEMQDFRAQQRKR